MARYLIQSGLTHKFLCADLAGGEPVWVSSLQAAGGGVFTDSEDAHQLVQDHCEAEDMPFLIDLDRLGTRNDYL